VSFTYCVLFSIKDAEGETSTTFRSMPTAARNVILQKEFFIRNNHTRTVLHVEDSPACGTPPKTNCSQLRKVFVDEGKDNDPKYLWKFQPVESKWKNENFELFYVINSMENSMLTVGSGELKIAEANAEQLKREAYF